ncbi:MAG TPA: sodium:solute symporter [Ktedonobacteraceae bacterium]|nr:sodium:solute symporter [Ktedonobacteraceae bacterium]
MLNWEMVTVFTIIFVAVTLLSLRATRWQVGELHRLTEWGVAGRRFGSVTAWFLLGGAIFSGNSMIAIPGLVFAKGAQGFYSTTYQILVYPLLFVVIARFWVVARHRGYVTTADFVRERFGRTVGLLIALTGILATMPYLAVQIYAIEVTLAQMGLPVEASLVVAFVLLSLSTYVGGLRAPALMAIVKDIMLVTVILVAWIVIPMKLGGLEHIFTLVHYKAMKNPKVFSDVLSPSQYISYSTQVLGAALALFLYPHTITVFGSVNSDKTLKRSAISLQFFNLLIGMTALLGYMAIAGGITSSRVYQTNSIVPALFTRFFPAWFAGFAFAAIVICALVPAAIMSIAVANLFSRNIYREYLNPSCNEQEELKIARAASFFVKCGALVFILTVPITFANNLQLLGSMWIVQTFPAVFLGLYTKWFHRQALVLGWIGSMAVGTWMVIDQGFASFYPFKFGTFTISIYTGLVALVVNLVLTVAFTPLFNTFGAAQEQDRIPAPDFVGSVN